MTRFNRLGMVLFFVVAAMAILGFNAGKPRLLILQSYDPAYSWSHDVREGVLRKLGERHFISVRWHYMDTKRHPFPEFRASAGRAAARVIDEWKPDVVVAVDDDAQQFVGRYYVNHPHIQWVFAGVNGEATEYGFDGANNVTGIYERSNLEVLRDTMELLAGGMAAPTRHIVHIGDLSETVQKDNANFEQFDWGKFTFEGRLVDNLDEWRAVVDHANQHADFILTSNYRQVFRSATNRDLTPPEEVVAVTEANSRLLVMGINGFYVTEGGGFSVSTSPFEQGEVATQMALDILDGKHKTLEIARVRSHQYLIYMRGSRLRDRGVQLPGLYDAFARATNHYYE